MPTMSWRKYSLQMSYGTRPPLYSRSNNSPFSQSSSTSTCAGWKHTRNKREGCELAGTNKRAEREAGHPATQTTMTTTTTTTNNNDNNSYLSVGECYHTWGTINYFVRGR